VTPASTRWHDPRDVSPMKALWALLSGVGLTLGAIVGGIVSLIECFCDLMAAHWTESLNKDYRDDPTYKKKLEELIERNKKFEDARDR
jgi:hypothetical protein